MSRPEPPPNLAEGAARVEVDPSRILLNFAQHVHESLDLERVVAFVAHYTSRLLGAQGAVVFLRDAENLVAAAVSGTSPIAAGASLPLDSIVAASERLTTQPSPGWEQAIARFGDGVSDLTIPLLSKNKCIGALMICSTPQRRFDHRDEALVVSLATHAAVAINNARAYESQRTHRLLHAERDRARLDREDLLVSALATMDQPVFILGLDRRIRYANLAAAKEYGCSTDELAVLSMDDLVASTVPARRIEAPDTIPGSTWIAEHVHQRRDGSRFPAAVVISYIRDQSGEPVGQVLNVRNLAEERRVEEKLRQSEKLAAVGELVAGVAHEINNPLAGISAFSQLLLDETLPDGQRESVRIIKQEADRATAIIRDLLTFARKSGPDRTPVDLNEVVRLATRLRAFNLRSTEVTLECDLDPAIPLVLGDAPRLQQVVLNLIVNAEHAMRGSSLRRLTIRTAAHGREVVLAISDTGTGMSEETRQRVFEPFFTTKSPGEGTGLGLSVSYGIIHGHGGSIVVETEAGTGTTFMVALPAAGPHDRAVDHR